MRTDEKLRWLWAKKGTVGDELRYLPLYAHLADAATVAGRLWNDWMPEHIKSRLLRGLCVFLAASHDLGKASPVFQAKLSHPPNAELDDFLRNALVDAGFHHKSIYPDSGKTRHELASHGILQRNGLHESLCVVLSGHHGKPPSRELLRLLDTHNDSFGFNQTTWIEAQNALLREALALSGLTLEEARSIHFSRAEQALASGFVIFSDWVASDENLFPLVDVDFTAQIDSAVRAESAMDKLEIPIRWEPDASDSDIPFFLRRFNIEKERPVQAKALAVARMQPGITVIEAPMGEGKTEAALAAAEVLAAANGLRGVYFALPTQATSNSMFKRINDWIKNFDTFGEKYSVRLAHRKADMNESYRMIKLSQNVHADAEEDTYNSAFVHEWFDGRKKGMLADFAVGTIDHVLMAGLKQKHLVLRHLGLAGKVVILDEVHAYDVYMTSYLLMALAWLGSYGVPMVVLSATLPGGRRRELIEAYTGKTSPPITSKAYPLITYSCDGVVDYEEIEGEKRSRDIFLKRTNDDGLLDELESFLSHGGCAGVIVNAVERAQKKYHDLAERFGKEHVRLLHARLLACDRSEREQELADALGPPDKTNRPEKLIVVGTQVLEQSLDFDFDILASDLCPMDLLLQRIGRLHRHRRENRPEPLQKAVCLVLQAEEGAELERGAQKVYRPYPLLQTRAVLPEKVRLPDDIPRLVAKVYDDENGEVFIAEREAYKTAVAIRERNAKSFQIGLPVTERKTLVGWLDTSIKDDSEQRGEAVVRDGTEAIEVIVVQEHRDGLRLLPWVKDGRTIPHGTPSQSLAVHIAGCSVRLPAFFGGDWIADKLISELEAKMQQRKLHTDWYASPLLKGCLCLILDEDMEATLCGYRFRYDKELGLLSRGTFFRQEKEAQITPYKRL